MDGGGLPVHQTAGVRAAQRQHLPAGGGAASGSGAGIQSLQRTQGIRFPEADHSGILFLGAAYALGIRGNAWRNLLVMAGTLALGIGGTFLLFQGMEYPIERLARSGSSAGRPNAFHFRQLQESVVNRSSSMAVCSLLLLAALCCLASGIAVAGTLSLIHI